MRDEQDGLAGFLPDAQQLDLHQIAGLGIERRERLVHQQDVRIGGERAGETDALLHAARELVRVVPFEADEADHLDEPLGDAVTRSGRDALQFKSELDVALHRPPGQEPELLEHHGTIGPGTGDFSPVHGQFAGIGPQQAEQDIEERALATAGWSDNRQELAFADVDIEAVQRAHRPAVRRPEGEVDVATLDIRCHATPRPLTGGRSLLFARGRSPHNGTNPTAAHSSQ